MNKKLYDENYNSSPVGRVRTARQYHNKHYPVIPEVDNLTGRDFERLFQYQNGECAACHCKFANYDGAEISHVSRNSLFQIGFLQLLCHTCNMVQRDLTIPFAWFEREYGKSFYQYFLDDREQIIEWFLLKPNDVKRIEKRINTLMEG